MENLTYRKEDEIILIKVPFELKDLFRSNFKTAKWNGFHKCWVVKNNTRNENKLKIWLEEVKEVNKKLEEQKELEDTEALEGKKLKELKKEVQKFLDQIKEKQKSISEINDILKEQKEVEKLLDEKRKELQVLSDDEYKRKKDLEEKLHKNEEDLKEIMDVDKVLETIKKMRDIQNGNDSEIKGLSHSKTRRVWEEKKLYIDSISEKLEEIGLESIGIDRVVYSNYNRPDRDDYYNVTREDILNIVQCKE